MFQQKRNGGKGNEKKSNEHGTCRSYGTGIYWNR